jgi:NAD(P)-dependent dehydrogenase (short-subunit alcohol dehydrogenase family)
VLVKNAIPTDQMAAAMNPIDEYTLEEFEGILPVALSGTFLNIKYGLQELLRAGGGSIVYRRPQSGQSRVRQRYPNLRAPSSTC